LKIAARCVGTKLGKISILFITCYRMQYKRGQIWMASIQKNKILRKSTKRKYNLTDLNDMMSIVRLFRMKT